MVHEAYNIAIAVFIVAPGFSVLFFGVLEGRGDRFSELDLSKNGSLL